MSKNILGIFDGYDIEGIKALVESLENSAFDYMKLEGDGMAITIGKNGTGEASAAVTAPAVVATPVAVTAAPVAAETTPAAAEPEVKAAADVVEQAGIVIIRSPSYGIFYAQSEPGAPPYVRIGDTVKEGNTVCLVEIMKTFNAITSPVDGEVVAIHIQNAEMLEPEQPLFSIRVK